MDGHAQTSAAGAVLDNSKPLPAARILIPLLFGFVTFFDSWDSIAIAFVAPSIAREWGLGPAVIGLIFAVGYAGQFVGAATSGIFTERFGRVRMFVIFAALMCLLAGLCALATSPVQLGTIRFLQGIGIGALIPIAISYLTEIAPTATRGRYITLTQFFTSSGFVMASIGSVWIIPELGWRWMFGIGLAPLAILPLILLLVPESPLWLASKGRMGAAHRAVQRLGLPDFEGVLNMSAKDGSGTGATARPGFLEIFRGPNLRLTLSLSSVWLLVAFVAFGMVSWLPSIYVSVYHLPIERALKYNAWGYVGYQLAWLFVVLAIDRMGRRRLSIGCMAIAILTFVSLALVHEPSESALVLLAIIGQNAAAIGLLVMWTYTSEAYSTGLRSPATGFVTSWARIASMIAPVVIGAILGGSGSIATVFTAFFICAALVMIIWFTTLKETKGRKLIL